LYKAGGSLSSQLQIAFSKGDGSSLFPELLETRDAPSGRVLRACAWPWPQSPLGAPCTGETQKSSARGAVLHLLEMWAGPGPARTWHLPQPSTATGQVPWGLCCWAQSGILVPVPSASPGLGGVRQPSLLQPCLAQGFVAGKAPVMMARGGGALPLHKAAFIFFSSIFK